MLTYAAIFILGCIAALALRRVFLVVLRAALLIVGVALAGRAMLMADARLARPEWISGAMVGGAVGFVVIGLLSYAIIYHALVAADERRDIEKARETAKRRRLW